MLFSQQTFSDPTLDASSKPTFFVELPKIFKSYKRVIDWIV